MNESLKKQGWKNMETILDKELPRDKKNNTFLFWLLIPTLLVGFGLGYAVHGVTTKPAIQPLIPEHVQPPMAAKTVDTEQAIEEPMNTGQIRTISNHVLNQKTAPLKPITPDNTVTALTSTGLYNFPSNHQETGTKEPLTTTESFQVVNSGTENLERIKIPPYQKLHGLLSDMPYPINKFNPIVEITSNWKLFHQMSLEVGSNWQKPTAQSGAIFYRLGWKNKKTFIYSSLGYRYVNYDISEKIDTLPYALTNSPVTPNEALQNQMSLEVGGVHQIIPAMGLGYLFSPNWYADISLRFPLNLNFKRSSLDLAQADQEGTASEFDPTIRNSIATQNNWDVQTCLTLGKKFNKNLSLTASASLGFIPIHAQALLSGKNLKYNQWTAGLAYTF